LIPRNPHFKNLQPIYLFQQIQERADQYPADSLLNLSIGDISLPIAPCVTQALSEATELMNQTPFGYGPSSGLMELREKVQEIYYPTLSPSEIYISDGAKCDIGRLQLLFDSKSIIGVQDPTYPVYSDTASILGGKQVHLLPCTQETDYFIDIENLPPIDLLFVCSPNNPTGHVATREQLTRLVEKAHQDRFLILYDTAYADFIQDSKLPKSIYEIEGAKEVAIETSSFSKSFGFTGLRLGWCALPKEIHYRSGEPLHKDWERVISTFFNGPSILVQKGGLAALSIKGLEARDATLSEYLKRASALREALHPLNPVGGTHSPYLWTPFSGRTSWEAFDLLLKECSILTIPGSGFGPSGEGYIRFSAFSKDSLKAASKLKEWVCSVV
jgi:LL-diaminopimelate aminotransferase